jgi:predicted GH43/DUF377 family glycosyl hydrolase
LLSGSTLPVRDKKIGYFIILFGLFALSANWLFSYTNSPLFLFLFFAVTLSSTLNLLIFKRPFFPYDRILSAVSNGDFNTWTKERGVRIDIAANYQVYYPKVVSLDNGWRMYYRGGGKRGGIVSAYSRDGLKWNPEQGFRIEIDRGDMGIVRVEGCEVIKIDDKCWRLYYSATDGNRWKIYISNSKDGLYWENDLLCLEVPSDDEYQDVKAPSIVYSDGLWKMFFMRFSKANTRIYTSVSTDGLYWSKMSKCKGLCHPSTCIRNPFVMSMPNGMLRMFFSERESWVDPSGAKIMSAVSLDGIHWSREEGVRIGPGKWYDKHGIFNVDIVPIETGYRMYYTGYWGRHLLEPLTLRYYRKRRQRADAPV